MVEILTLVLCLIAPVCIFCATAFMVWSGFYRALDEAKMERSNVENLKKDKFAKYCDELIICTDDGTAGIKGLVTDGIKAAMEKHSDIDELIAIGPPIMMKFCAETTREKGIKTLVSLNPIMIDGTGMCGGCRVSVGGKMKFACVDGPDFDGHEVDFDGLMSRLGRFVEDEKQAMDKWSEECRLMEEA